MATKLRRPGLILSTQFLVIVIATIVLSMVVDFGRKAAANYRIQRERERLEREIAAAREEYQRLLERRDYVRTDEYVEKVAREELKWVRPGEKVAVIKVVLSSIAPAFPAPTPVPMVGRDKSHWKEWWALFLP